jgi:hypothetical protein
MKKLHKIENFKRKYPKNGDSVEKFRDALSDETGNNEVSFHNFLVTCHYFSNFFGSNTMYAKDVSDWKSIKSKIISNAIYFRETLHGFLTSIDSKGISVNDEMNTYQDISSLLLKNSLTNIDISFIMSSWPMGKGFYQKLSDLFEISHLETKLNED